ncbi:hypothetical protein MKK84_19570 [Methylobacterium sp. E-065]|uniref:hypothetical protein n=1 Tax=Methylobacterium sp. E-065 TaxID=2836583 RepID=UPI001FBBED27|nr:hypothetical protein [Methylobacterium sp. E-065]MCJ2019606.1 hypothetical protein [Methylobacterium sp. E-065]
MIAVQYDPDTDQIWITGDERSYARRSLIASLEDGDRVGIRLKFSAPDDFKLKTLFSNLMDGNGATFASPADAKAYLDGIFAWRRATSEMVATSWVGARALSAPRAVRSLGDQTLDYASASDISQRGAVLGVTASASDVGMPATVIMGGQLVSQGWQLVPGLPLFLGEDGLITQVPPSLPMAFSLRLGMASDPDTAIIRIAQPIALT